MRGKAFPKRLAGKRSHHDRKVQTRRRSNFLCRRPLSPPGRTGKELKVPVIPFLEGVQGHRELLLGDGAHPTGEGYTIVVQNILKVLQPVLKEKEA